MDGGFVVVGTTRSSQHPGLVLKLDRNGSIQWQKAHQIGGSITDVAEASDGSLLVASLNNSYEGAYVAKHRANGSVIWKRGLDTSGVGDVSDGDLDEVNGGAVVVIEMSYTSWVWRLNSDGSTAWKNQYGQSGNFQLESIRHTADGGFIVAGRTGNYGAQNWDGWVLKLNHDGTIAWQNIYGGEAAEYLMSIRQTTDGGYIAAGSAGDSGWLLKLKGDGSVSWSKSIAIAGKGELDSDEFWAVEQTSDGGYVAVGQSKSNDPYLTQGWAAELNTAGEVMWQRLYDFNMIALSSIQEPSDGGLVIAARTGDVLILRTDSQGRVPDCENISLTDGSVSDYSIAVQASTASPITLDAAVGGTWYTDNGTLSRTLLCPAASDQADCPSP